MANYSNLIASIRQVIVPDNHANEIGGGDVLNSLLSMISALGAGYQFMGVATIGTSPGTPDYNVFYLAGAGTYPNFGGTIVASGELGVFTYNGTWQYRKIAIGSGGGSGSQVSWTQIQQSGTQIAKITIDGVETNIFAPTSGGGSGITNVRINGNLGTVADNVVDLGSGFVKTSDITGFLPLSAGSGKALTGDLYAHNIVPNGDYALGSTSARWGALYMEYSNNKGIYFQNSTTQVPGLYISNTKDLYIGGYALAENGGRVVMYGQSITLVSRQSGSTTNALVVNNTAATAAVNLLPDATANNRDIGSATQKWRTLYVNTVNATNLVATGYVQTPVIRNSGGIDKITLYSNVTILANTIIGGNLYPDATNRNLGITGNPWKNIYIADNGGLYFGAFGGSTAVRFIAIDEDLNFGTRDTTISTGTPKRHRIYGSSIQGIVQSSTGTGTYVISDARYNANAAIYEIAPTVDGDVNLGSYTYRWNRLYAKAWYPTTSSSADAPHIEYVAAEGSTPGYFKILGNLVATGFITAGGINANTGDTSINGNLIPSDDARYSLGSSGMRFKDAYFSGSIGSNGAPVNEIYATTIGEDASPGRIANIYAENIKSANTLTINKLATTTIAFTMPASSGGSATIAALTSALANIKAGQVYTLVDSTNNYNLRLTGWRMISTNQHEIYTGAFKFVQNSSTPNNWTVTKL